MQSNKLSKEGVSVFPNTNPAALKSSLRSPTKSSTKKDNKKISFGNTTLQKPKRDEPDVNRKTKQELVESSSRLYVVNAFQTRIKSNGSWISESGRTTGQYAIYDLGEPERVEYVTIAIDVSDIKAPRECSLSCALIPNGSFQPVGDFVVDLTWFLALAPG